MKNIKKSQISIFIIIAILIIFLLVFLIYMSNNAKKEELISNEKEALSETDSKLFPLKDNVDLCLERQLRKAIIVSGAKGGFIFENDEYYQDSVVVDKYYDPRFIDILGLDFSYLTDGVLTHLEYDLYSPGLENNVSDSQRIIYTHSVKDDFETFILDEFLKCIQLDEYEKQGFDVVYESFSSTLETQITESKIRTKEILGSVGSTILVNINDEDFLGKIIENDFEKGQSIVNFSQSVFKDYDNIELENIKFRNINSTINVEVYFNEENVGAHLFFPVTVKNDEFDSSYHNSYKEIEVRLKALLEMSKVLLEAKKVNRSLDLTDITTIDSILRENNKYYRNSPSSKKVMSFYKTVLHNTTDENKYFVYTIADNNSKILGRPFIFNYAYVNNAPFLDKIKASEKFQNDGNSFVYISLAQGEVPPFNIRNYLSEKQYIDNFLAYFIPDKIKTSRYKFEIESNGDILFESFEPGINSINIRLTDGEAVKVENLVFISGHLSNENNEESPFCFSFVNSPIVGTWQYSMDVFPINIDYQKVLSTKDSSGKVTAFAYDLYQDSLFLSNNGLSLPDSYLQIKKSCLVDPDLVTGSYTIKDLRTNSPKGSGDLTEPDFKIPIAPHENPIEVTVILKDKRDGSELLEEPYTIKIFPKNCLGPEELSDTDKAFLETSLGSCCDLDKAPLDKMPTGSQDTVKNLRTSGNLNMDMYFLFDAFGVGPYSSNNFDFKNKNLWGPEMKLENPTSLFTGRIEIACKGQFPRFEDNVERISPLGSDVAFSNRPVYSYTRDNQEGSVLLRGSGYDRSYQISLSYEEKLGLCQFSLINKYFSLQINVDYNKDGSPDGNFLFNTGFIKAIKENNDGWDNKPYIGPLPSGNGFDDVLIKCDEDTVWYGTKSKSYSSWTYDVKSGYGKGEYENPFVAVSRGYCILNSPTCGGRTDSPSFASRTDGHTEKKCIDYFFSGGGLFSSITKPTDWPCSQPTTP